MNPRILGLLVLSFLALLVAIAIARLRAAEERAADAVLVLNAAAADAREVMALRARHETVAPTLRPREDVYASISRTLLECGLPAGTLRDLAPEGDRPVEGNPGVRVQTMRFSLEPITPEQLGIFLSQWRDTAWSVASIELSHLQSKTDDSFNCRLSITATYLASAAPARAVTPQPPQPQ